MPHFQSIASTRTGSAILPRGGVRGRPEWSAQAIRVLLKVTKAFAVQRIDRCLKPLSELSDVLRLS